MNSIFKRRSIRRFKDTPLTEDQKKMILKAGMASPTSENNREWVFIVIDDDNTRQTIVKDNPYAGALKTAPFVVLLCADMRKVSEPENTFWVQGMSAATQNMLLEATELGLGSLWMGIHSNVEQSDIVRALCALPKYIEPVSLVAFGTAQREKTPNDRYLEDSIFYNRYPG